LGATIVDIIVVYILHLPFIVNVIFQYRLSCNLSDRELTKERVLLKSKKTGNVHINVSLKRIVVTIVVV
jgi:hypothetical protein